MKRREFIQKAAVTSAGILSVPYFLPSGRLFAQTNPPLAEHVVFVMFAGGVRQQEGVLKRYLADSQKIDIEGNIFYNMLMGNPPEDKIAYGLDDIANNAIGAIPISPILTNTLQQQGVLFPEVRYSKGGTGHFAGLNTSLTGYYGYTQGLQNRPLHPTIFEYLRRFAGFKATDTWLIGLDIGGSRPLLNYSTDSSYGRRYGANFFAPRITFGKAGEEFFKGFKNYHPEQDLKPIAEIRDFLNNNFLQEGLEIPHLYNSVDEKQQIKEFVRSTFEKLEKNQITFPPIRDNGDLINIGFATEILKWFKPKLTVIEMGAVDVCHGDFTSYLKAMHRADHGIGFLWNFIQTQIPEMANKTIMIIQPEFGRDEKPNPITDDNDWFAFDHSSSDGNARRMFSMMLGPNIDKNLVVGSEANPVGDASDIVPTIAEIFGIKQAVQDAGLLDGNALSLFDRI